MKKACLVGAALLAAGCSGSGDKGADPVAKMFDSSYGVFADATGAQKGGCELAVKADGDVGKKKDSWKSTLELDGAGNVRVGRDGEWETVRVGGSTWQKSGDGKLEKVESGARADQLRDDAIAGWRPVLAPFRSRIHLKRTGSKSAGKREIETYELSGDAGGGSDGGPELGSLAGTVELDAATGFPVAIDAHGAWDAPAPERSQGRVAIDLDKLVCQVSAEPVPTITPPVGAEPAASPGAKPAASAKPAATATPKPAAKPATKTPATTKHK
jgi:hypothetical protein